MTCRMFVFTVPGHTGRELLYNIFFTYRQVVVARLCMYTITRKVKVSVEKGKRRLYLSMIGK
jgi:hypothetical protein